MLEHIAPMDIEKRSFAIITELLGEKQLDPENGIVRISPIPGMFDEAVNGDME